METRRAYLAGAVRTPIGNFGGALAGSSAELAKRGAISPAPAAPRLPTT